MKLLVLGGYGVFGGRLVDLISDLESIEILVCGRSLSKARKFCSDRSTRARLLPLAIDRSSIETALHRSRPDLVIDASGPFQEYGQERYSVVEACIRCRVNYMDFADASDFVAQVAGFDEAARKAGIFVLSGVSSFPVLTAAVVRELQGHGTITAVKAGIAPSPYAGVGLNVMRAVLGYAGGQVMLKRNGAWQTAYGMTESLRYTVAPPGRLPLRNLRYSLVDVPDLRVIPRQFREVADIWIGAGPVPEFLHRMLNGLAKVRRALQLPSLEPLARVCHWVINHVRYGEHRGGMFVEVTCRNGASRELISWHLVAEADDGPFIPSMAVEILVRKLVSGNAPQSGARPALLELTLSDYQRAFADRRIYTGVRRNGDGATGIFRAVLADSLDALPRSLRNFHTVTGDSQWHGTATVHAARNPVARLLARLFHLPLRSGQVPVRVLVERRADVEHWTREFGDATFSSTLRVGNGPDEFLVCERFGWVTVSLALVIRDRRLYFVPRRWRIGVLRLPGLLLPRGDSYEFDHGGRFSFNVRFEVPIVGLIAVYEGSLEQKR